MIISKTPLRCSFFGGGTDFKDYYENSRFGYGSTISTALNMFVYITVNRKFDDKIRVVYSGNELVDSVDEVKHNIIRNALKITGIEKSIEVIYMADIPLSSAGIGLASSSALAVGVLNALHAYKGEHVSAETLAREACHIEIDCLGQRIGIQDQFAVACGGFNQYKYNRDGSVSVEPIICKKENSDSLKENLMLFFTGLTRDSRKILNEQQQTIAQKMDGLDNLVLAVNRVYQDLVDGSVDNWGYELDKAWQIKKRFASGVSTPMIDEMYSSAKNAGALGGKILGAGGGGFMLLYVPAERQAAVEEALKDYRKVDFSFEPLGSRIIFSD
ncbi:GHMP kinase [Caproicibacter sp.]|uniref:GHMP family kinase ATP-binding protein n=1 Tax=Caproicibacter sp. TaxID=2814884 RepID=UPI003988FB83